jgi:hypothetical protein
MTIPRAKPVIFISYAHCSAKVAVSSSIAGSRRTPMAYCADLPASCGSGRLNPATLCTNDFPNYLFRETEIGDRVLPMDNYAKLDLGRSKQRAAPRGAVDP